jgi:acetylglutamate kinase
VLGLFEPTDAPDHAARIHRHLEKAGVPSEILPVDGAERIIELARGGTIPILVFTLSDGSGEERVARLGTVLSALHTRKLIFLHRPGGLRQNGVLVPIANVNQDASALLASKELSRKERALVAQSARLVLELVPHKLLVAITSPLNLFRELFTVKGAGTLLRRGAELHTHASLAEIDRDRLRALLASAFGQPPVDEFFSRPVARVYLEEGYRGVAVVADTPLGSYLTKFAVEREAQGEGMGRDLWERLVAEHPTVFWRARTENPIVAWYEQKCDGMMRFAGWNVYWKGLDAQRVPAATEYALAQPIDIPHPTGE